MPGRLSGGDSRLDEVLDQAVMQVVEIFRKSDIPSQFWDSDSAQAFIKLVLAAGAPAIEEALMDDILLDVEQAKLDDN